MRTLYRSVHETLQRVDFPALFPGFHAFPFALYNQNTVYLPEGEIPCDNHFYEGNIEVKFNQFMRLSAEKTEGSFFICGYDPMNMVKRNGMVLCSHFVMLQNAAGEARFLKGPVLLHMENGSYHHVLAYEAVRAEN